MKLGFFTAFRDMHRYYIRSCEELGIPYEVIDLIGPNWLEEVMNSDCDGFLCRPPSKYQERKSMFDERLYTISNFLGKKIYPSYDELFIYENKKMMSYWLKINNFPHAETKVFYDKKQFMKFLDEEDLSVVIKTNIGSTAKGWRLLKNKAEARFIADMTFGKGSTKVAPDYTKQYTGKIFRVPAIDTIQKHFLIVQKFEKIKWDCA